MKRLAALLLAALPAAAQIDVTTAPCSMTDGSCSSTSSAVPATCTTAGMVPVFLGSPLALGCDAGISYDATTRALTLGGPIRARQAADSATLGVELATNGGFTTDLTDWTGASWAWEAGADGQARHTAGSTTALSQNVTVVSGATYQIAFDITGRTAGAVSVSLGAVALNQGGTTSWSASNTGSTLVAAASGAVSLTIAPTTDFNGALRYVSVKNVVLGTAPASQEYRDASGAIYAETRGSVGLKNDAHARDALSSNTTGMSNSVGAGQYALSSNTTGNGNVVGAGAYALYSNTTGSNNSVGAGVAVLYDNTTGSSNSVGAGLYALTYNTTGSNNSVGAGDSALYENTTGSNNTATGFESGYNTGAAPSYANAVTTGSYLTFLGARAGLGSPTQRTNSTAIGAGAYVDANNTVVLGNGAVTNVMAGSTGAARFTGGTATLSALPVYADNAAATAGGLTAGQLYRTATGVLMVRY